MAVAKTRTLLPLDTFAKIIGISPLYFNQIELNVDDPTGRMAMQPATICEFPLVQYSWQQGAANCVGREEIAQAIADAETMLTTWLGFAPGVDWVVDDNVEYPRPANPAIYGGYGINVRGLPPNVKASMGYVQMGGVRAKTLIAAGRPIVYSDPNGDTYKELATVTVVTTVTAEDEIALYYPGHAGDDEWEIRPITVRIAAGTATITLARAQLVSETILEAFVAQAADGSDDADFLTTVDVYRKYNDPATQANLLSRSGYCGACGESDTCLACTFSVQTGCIAVQDKRRGLVAVTAADWDADAAEFNYVYPLCAPPQRMQLYYRAGWINSSLRNPYIEVDPKWARVISYLALSLLDRPLCTCEALRAYTMHWAEDLAASSSTPSGGTQNFQLATMLLDNPFGTSRAAIYAWRQVQRERLGEVVLNL